MNPANWVLERDGSVVQNAVRQVTFGFNASLGKWEAVLTLDGNVTVDPASTSRARARRPSFA